MRYSITPDRPRIIIAEDEKGLRLILEEFLAQNDYLVDVAEDGLEALEKIKAGQYALLIADIDMPRMSGMELLQKLMELKNRPLTILMTGYATVESAVDAMKMGAFDYIVKPFKMEHLLLCIQRALEKRRLEFENIQLKETLTIYNLSEAMTKTLNIKNIVDLVTKNVQSELDADLTALQIFEPETEDIMYEKVESNFTIDYDEIKKSINLETIKNMLQKDMPVVLPSWRVREVFKSPMVNYRCYSILCVGIKIQDIFKGLIFAFSFTKGKEFHEGQRKFVAVLADRAAIALENSKLYSELQRSFQETIQALVKALEAKDVYTRGHSERVTQFARFLAEDLGLSDYEVEKVTQAALLHDIGKIGMKLEVLHKPGKLTGEETRMFRNHPLLGRQILESVTALKEIAPYVYYHHERWDGGGYPEGKKGEEIPVGARILNIADSFTCMTENRPYRKALSIEEAAKELLRCSGTQFDPVFVDVFLKGLKKRRIIPNGFKIEKNSLQNISGESDKVPAA
jgi:putative nucleotidyltransferase with HDIG domain